MTVEDRIRAHMAMSILLGASYEDGNSTAYPYRKFFDDTPDEQALAASAKAEAAWFRKLPEGIYDLWKIYAGHPGSTLLSLSLIDELEKLDGNVAGAWNGPGDHPPAATVATLLGQLGF